MVSKQNIADFFAGGKIAVAGVSRDEKKFSTQAFKHLLVNGFDAVPVNPNADSIGGINCFPSAGAVPDDYRSLLIITPKGRTNGVLEDALGRGYDNIWIQQFSDTPDALKAGRESGANFISKKCIFMFTEPVKGIHKFHRTIMGIFGRLPK